MLLKTLTTALPRTGALLAASVLFCACTSDIAENYRIDYDYQVQERAENTAAAAPEDAVTHNEADKKDGKDEKLDLMGAYQGLPAKPGAVPLASGPYDDSRPLNSAAPDYLKQVTARAYAKAQELSAPPAGGDRPAPQPVGTAKDYQDIKERPYPVNSRIYPYYRPYPLPIYRPGQRWGGTGFGAGIGLWRY